MSRKLSLRVENRIEELERITAAVEDLAESEGWPPSLAFRVNLVLEEFGINVINYAHQGDAGVHDFEITLLSEPDILTIEITDDGVPFNPLEDKPMPDTSAPMDERPIGGLGIHLVRTMTEDMRYERENSQNHSTLVMRKSE